MTSFPSPVVKPSSIPGRSISTQTSQQKHFMDLPFSHSSSPIQKLNSPTPRFQDNIDDYDDVFLSTPPSSQPSRRPQYRVIDVPPDPSGTWMKGGIQDADEDRGNQSRSILTPPESFQRLGNSFAVDGRESYTPITPTKDKGKARAHNMGTTPWQKIQDDPVCNVNISVAWPLKVFLRFQEHPFHERASLLRDPFQTQAQPLPRHLLEPTSGSMVSLLTNQQAELSADHIETLLQGLTTIPDYVRKLERKKTAAEKSNNAKARKIAELEGEVQKWVSSHLFSFTLTCHFIWTWQTKNNEQSSGRNCRCAKSEMALTHLRRACYLFTSDIYAFPHVWTYTIADLLWVYSVRYIFHCGTLFWNIRHINRTHFVPSVWTDWQNGRS